jgi:hypothetical protein
MTDDLRLRWVATQFNNDPPEVDDGCLEDDGMTVGRCRLENQVNPKGWVWVLTCASGSSKGTTTRGVEETKEAGKAALEASYRAWVALDPDNRRYLLGDAETRRAIRDRQVERARAAERDRET